ncbi:MAG: hypothetical protein JW959_10095 [Pirellulales bacterium]|nr:hypothetical protein [Pirellulales bacterium]
MARNHSHGHDHPHCRGCCGPLDRREFMATVGLTTLAAQGILGSGTAARAATGDGPEAAAKPARPRVRAVFLHPKTERYWMGWPGAGYDIKARDAEFAKYMTDAAKELDVELEIDAEPIAELAGVDKLLAECKKSPPDGMIAVVGALCPEYWPHADKLAAGKGDVPLVVFTPMGTSFTGHLQATRKIEKCFVAATQDHSWLRTGMRMLRTIWDMKNTRLCIINGEVTRDDVAPATGTILHWIPLSRWTDELAKQEETDEVKALAKEFAETAEKIVEPDRQDILNAAKNYFVARRIMEAEKCQGISLNCLDLVRDRKIFCPPCMAWQRLNDERSVGCCECDWNAAIAMRLCSLLTGRPGFQQDPAPNTVNGTLMGAHCSSPRKLRGFGGPSEPCILRSHSESDVGVAPQVIWPVGEPVTVIDFDEKGRLILGTGEVAANIDTPPCGGCRTSVELKMDHVEDPRDCKGFHQLFILGRHDRLFRAYCKLAGIDVVPIA